MCAWTRSLLLLIGVLNMSGRDDFTYKQLEPSTLHVFLRDTFRGDGPEVLLGEGGGMTSFAEQEVDDPGYREVEAGDRLRMAGGFLLEAIWSLLSYIDLFVIHLFLMIYQWIRAWHKSSANLGPVEQVCLHCMYWKMRQIQRPARRPARRPYVLKIKSKGKTMKIKPRSWGTARHVGAENTSRSCDEMWS